MYRLENNIIKTDHFPTSETYRGGVGYFCFNFMKKHAEKVAQINISTNEEETYGTLLQKCIRASVVLQKIGIKKGDIITICSKTNLNSCIPLIACFLIGAVPSYIDTTFLLIDTIHYVNSIDPKLFLVTPDFVDTIHNILKSQHNTTDVVVFNDDFMNPLSYEVDFVPVYVEDLQETAIIHFSSGSTGFPKAICINHYGLVYSRALSFDNIWINNEPKVVLSFDSLYWSIESLRLLCSIKEGACRLISSDENDVNQAWYILEKYKANIAFLTPWTLVNMIESEKPADIDLKKLTTIFIEGCLLPAKYHRALQEFLPHVDIFHWYGQTEAGELTTFRKTDLHRKYNNTKPGCVGTPIEAFGASLKVVDIEDGNILGPNKFGELRVKSRAVMNGYHNQDSSHEFDEEGWLKTGDMVYYDEDFCFFIVDRIKDIILFQGWHIAPAPLEAELLSHPAVKIAAVVGVPDERNTELAVGLVVLNENFSTVTAIEIEKYVEERVPDKHRLRGGVKIIKESQLQIKSKLKRFKLKQLLVSGKI